MGTIAGTFPFIIGIFFVKPQKVFDTALSIRQRAHSSIWLLLLSTKQRHSLDNF